MYEDGSMYIWHNRSEALVMPAVASAMSSYHHFNNNAALLLLVNRLSFNFQMMLAVWSTITPWASNSWWHVLVLDRINRYFGTNHAIDMTGAIARVLASSLLAGL